METQKKIPWGTADRINPGSEDEWLNYRCGKITGSEVWKLFKNGKYGDPFTQTGYTYLFQKVAEILTGLCQELPDVRAIEWGKYHEYAASEILKQMGYDFEFMGGSNRAFFHYDKASGSSPDGLAKKAVVEIKCPYKIENHVKNVLGARSDYPVDFLQEERFEYFIQIYFNMLCTRKEEGLFVSYDPRPVNPKNRIAIIEVKLHSDIAEHLVNKVKLAEEFIKSRLTFLL